MDNINGSDTGTQTDADEDWKHSWIPDTNKCLWTVQFLIFWVNTLRKRRAEQWQRKETFLTPLKHPSLTSLSYPTDQGLWTSKSPCANLKDLPAQEIVVPLFSQVDQHSYFESQLNMMVRLSTLLEVFIILSVLQTINKYGTPTMS